MHTYVFTRWTRTAYTRPSVTWMRVVCSPKAMHLPSDGEHGNRSIRRGMAIRPS